MTISITPILALPMLQPGDDLPALTFAAVERSGLQLCDGDILVVCQKVVSKSEGRLVDVRSVTPSPFAEQIAATTQGKDARIIEIILRETTRVVKMDRGHLIVETGRGWICANAGVDESNSGDANVVVLLPQDPDGSAQRIVQAAMDRLQRRIAVIVTDTFGRPWREGLLDFALGLAGMEPLLDQRGSHDLDGRELHHTIHAQADALAAAAGLVMRKGAGIPVALVRGYAFTPAAGGAQALIRAPGMDLFR
jgi:coenzyme F420-0:L-glutamate ligase/coenzyme F420-1:gamma-L-glutamate ligase